MGGATGAVAAVAASLAGTDLIARAQRDHGLVLISAYALVLFAAALWIVAVVVSADRLKTPERARSLIRLFFWVGRNAAAVAVLLFFLGIASATAAFTLTQQDNVRPTVQATYDSASSVLSITAKVEGLSNQRGMIVKASGFVETRVQEWIPRLKLSRLVNKIVPPPGERNVIFFALLGPDADGNVEYKATAIVPKNLFDWIQVTASTSAATECNWRESTKIRQPDRAGCAAIRIRRVQPSDLDQPRAEGSE